MNFKLKTSKITQETLQDLKDKTAITPNILSRYAISLALTNDFDRTNINFDSNGQEFNRNVLLGDYDKFLKLLIENDLGKPLSEDEYFPKTVKLYLENGVAMLNGNYSLAKNKDSFIRSLIELNTGRSVV